jgi:hypothetical protein
MRHPYFRTLSLALVLCCASLAASAGTGFDARFRLYVGNLNGDQYTDLYAKWTPKITTIALDDLFIPIPLTRRDVPDFVLQGAAGGTFNIVSSLTAAQQQAVSGWPAASSSVEVSTIDANFDGKIDLIIRNLVAIIAGADNQIILASQTPGAAPVTARPLNAAMRSFYRELSNWFNAPDVTVIVYDVQWVYIGSSYAYDPFICAGYVDCYIEYDAYSEVYRYYGAILIPFPVTYRDYELPNQRHLDFAQVLYDMEPNGEIPYPSSAASVLQQILDEMWGRVGTIIIGQTPPEGVEPEMRDDWNWKTISEHLFRILFEVCVMEDNDTRQDCWYETWGEIYKPANALCREDPFEPGAAVSFAITGPQHAMSAAGQRRPFWLSRLESCDPFAPAALGVVDERGMGKVTMQWLRSIAQHKGIQFNEQQLGVEIMRAHVSTTVGDTYNIYFLLSKNQITNYHQDVFSARGFPDYTFGGAPYGDDTWGGRKVEDILGAAFWCPGCDNVPPPY